MHLRKLILILLITNSLSSLFAQPSWTLQKEDDQIKVYFRQKQENLYEIRVNTSFDVSADYIIYHIENIEKYPEWVYRCTDAHFIENNPNSKIIRTITNIPWPFKDRDVITKIHKPDKKGNISSLYSEAIPDYYPPDKNYKRQEFAEAKWELEEKGNKTIVTYYLNLRIEQNVPEKILGMVVSKGPYESFLGLHERVK